jgi:hypothetical protein
MLNPTTKSPLLSLDRLLFLIGCSYLLTRTVPGPGILRESYQCVV